MGAKSILEFSHPPLVEALCEIHFDYASDATVNNAESFREKARVKYPISVPIPIVQIGLQINAGNASEVPPEPPPLPEVRFQDEAGRRIVQWGRKFLSVHMLRPYEPWPALRQLVEEAVGWRGETGVKFRISLRYINRFQGGKLTANNINDILAVGAPIPKGVGGDAPFEELYTVTRIPKGDNGSLVVILALSSPETPKGSSIILDLGFGIKESIFLDKLGNTLDVAHENIEKAFAQFLTKKTLEALKEG